MKTKNKPMKTRDWHALAAIERHAERDMGNKRDKGRTRLDQESRSQVKWKLKSGDYDG
jgi:hypothetical protein